METMIKKPTCSDATWSQPTSGISKNVRRPNLPQNAVETNILSRTTRVTSTTSALINHIYTSNEENVLNAHVSQIGLSDHYTTFCCRKINFSLKSSSHQSIKYRSFKSFDENAFLQDLSVVPWSEIDLPEDADDMLDAWYSFFVKTIDTHAPIKTHRNKNENQLDWVTSDILVKIKQRDNLKKQGKFENYIKCTK